MTQPSTTEAPAVVMIVDDVPANLAMLHDALEQAGYRVRVATSGVRALESVQLEPPDLILLDAVMPGLDGFETCRRLKSDLVTRHIPVLFMTGLTDSDDVVRGFECGGADYVTKPVRTQEVLARIGAHLSNARVMAEAQQAADAAGDAIVAVDVDCRVRWATPLARRWLGDVLDADARLPAALRQWLGRNLDSSFNWPGVDRRLVFSRLGAARGGDRRLLIQSQVHVPEPAALMRALKLTQREAEVLHWVALGKTNTEVGAVLEMSPRTVNKHLEHIFQKLSVETRTAATTVAINKGRTGNAPADA
ncbi:response regulator [Panacagrimonas sp.]|uniref:response regulator n=1 Tax=Panacagrimonas sp. TaxID=2480088 RepID=UPI003B515B97